jgi:TatD DNase family protein
VGSVEAQISLRLHTPNSELPTLMIDTHCHLTDERLAGQLDAVLSRARAAGLTRVITIGTDPADWDGAIALCRRDDLIRCAVGLHPCYLPNKGTPRSDAPTPSIDELQTLLTDRLAQPGVVALGEIGLDRHWDDSAPTVRLQREYFAAQLDLASRLNKPVILHTREAIADALDVLASFANVRAVFHSFTGTPEEARQIVDRGYTVGFTGPVTYKKNDALREAATLVPVGQLFVETDAPYLSPEPVRSQRVNEPAHVVHVARQIAELKGMRYDAFDAALAENVTRFFG